MRRSERELVKEFTKVGLKVEVVAKRKHFFIYHRGGRVYKFSQGTKAPSHAVQSVRQAVRRCLQAEKN